MDYREYPSVVEKSSGLSWLREFRRQAQEIYRDLSWPSTKEEEWRRTDISHIKFDDYLYDGDEFEETSIILDAPKGLSGSIHFSRDRCLEIRLSEDLAQKGVIFKSLGAAFTGHGDLLSRYFMKNIRPGDGKLEAMHASFCHCGVFLYVPKFLEIALPFVINFDENGTGYAGFPHVLIVMDSGAHAVVRQNVSSSNRGVSLCNAVTSIYLEDGAVLQYLALQQLSDDSFYFNNGWASLARDSQLYSLFGNFGSALTKTRFGTSLLGQGAMSRLYGISFADHNQHFDQRTVQNHEAGHATSNVLFKSAVKDKARTVYQGMIRVYPDAQKTDAYQANRNLLLNQYARADSIPSLQIEANDVRCTHGATTGKVDNDEIFYLMSRGLSREEAKKLIVTGFFSEILKEIPTDIADDFHTAVESKLAS